MIGGSSILRGMLIAVIAAALIGPAAEADDASRTADSPSDLLALVPEVTLPVGLIMPGQPVRVRFILRNTSDAPVRIPLDRPQPDNAGIGLPHSLLFGSDAAPATQLIYENEPPITLRAPAISAAGLVEMSGERAILLGPRASLGTDINLQPLHSTLRYAGNHRVVWRPLDGRVGEASVRFRIDPRQDAVVVTDYGKITFKLNYDQAPLNVANFLELVRDGFYDGTPFHLIAAGVAIQGGRPDEDGPGTRPDGKLLPAEFGSIPFEAGTLAMALKPNKPDSASCQFFITLARMPKFDGAYTVIGQARDEQSLRTLSRLGEIPTDRAFRPLDTVLVRSINLIETDYGRTRGIELGVQPSTSTTVEPEPMIEVKPD